MPRIRPYESQISPQGQVPSQGADLSAVGGTGLERLGGEIVQGGYSGAHAYQILQAHEDARAVTETHVGYATLSNDLTQEFEQAKQTANPSDPNFFQTWFYGGAAEGEPANPGSPKARLDALHEQITNAPAKNVSREQASSLTSKFLNQSMAFQVQLAGQHAKQQAETFADKMQSMVLVNPVDYGEAMGKITEFVDNKQGIFYGPGMNDTVRDGVKQQMVKQVTGSMVQGMITHNMAPLVIKKLDEGAWGNELTGEQRVALRSQAETQIRGMEADAKRKEAEEAKKKRDHSDTLDSMLAEKELLNRTGQSNAGPVTWKDILSASASGLDSDKVKTWMNKLEERAGRITNGEIKTNVATKLDLFKRIGLPAGDPRKITDSQDIANAYLGVGYQGVPQLSDSDHDWLTRRFLDAKSPDGDKLTADYAKFYKHAEQYITKPGPFGIYADPTKGFWLDTFMADAEARKQDYIKAGKDPRDLINPTKPEYLGRPEFMSKYSSNTFGAFPPLPATPPSTAQNTVPRKSLDDIFGGKK